MNATAKSIYRSPEGREAVLALYARRVARLSFEVESRSVVTRFGPAHVLAAGPADGRPLVLLHGAGSSAVDLAETLGSVGGAHRQFFVDLPGEPNRSGEKRPDKEDDGYGLWMKDVLDGLGLERVSVFGVSLGAFVSLKCAVVMPERLSRLALMVPEGLARPRLFPFLRSVLLPAIRYKLSPSEANARRFIEALAEPGTEIPKGFMEQMVHFLEHVEYTARPGPLIPAADLHALTAPVFVVAAARDVLFPGDRVARRARAVIPNLREVVVVPEAGHVYFGGPDGLVLQRLSAFLSEVRPRSERTSDLGDVDQ